MIFRVKHENIISLVLLILSFLVFGGLSFVFVVKEMPAPFLMSMLVLQCTAIIMFAVLQTKKTVITVGNKTITIKYAFSKKTFNIGEIYDIRIDRYERRHKSHYIEKRMRMTLNLLNGKSIVLNDTAMSGTGGVLTIASREVSDEYVELYKAYQAIKSRMQQFGCG